MTDNTQPEALRLADALHGAVRMYPQISEDEPGGYCTEQDQLMDDAATALCVQHTRIAELEAQLEAIGAGGVQALSAAPARPTVEQVEDEVSMGHGAWDMVDPQELIGAVLRLAASPTPPVEQQIKKPNVVLELPDGDDRVAKVFFSEIKGDTLHLCITVTEQAAPKAAPATQQAGELVSVPKTVFEKCEVALNRYSQAPTDYHNAVLRLRDSVRDLIAAAAPQQEAQEPVVAAVFDEQLGRPVLVEGAPLLRHGQELYTAPQPAPAPLSEREAFEAAWEKLHGKRPVLWDTAFKEAKMDVPAHSAGKYFYRDAQAAWKAWQARAALAAQEGKA